MTENRHLSVQETQAVELLVQTYDHEDTNKLSEEVCNVDARTAGNDPNNKKNNVTMVSKLISITLTFIVLLDAIVLFQMIHIYVRAGSYSDSAMNSTCNSMLQYLFDTDNILISLACFVSMCLFAASIKWMSKHRSKLSSVIVYVIVMVIHSILAHYQGAIISNMTDYSNDTAPESDCIDITSSIMTMRYLLTTKSIALPFVFITIFANRIYQRFMAATTTNAQSRVLGNCKRFCFCMYIVIFTMLIIAMIDVYFNQGFIVHNTGILLSVLFAKTHVCSCSNHGHHIHLNGTKATTTYDANAVARPDWKCEKCQCCPAGCGIDCKSGCCECDKSENCCVVGCIAWGGKCCDVHPESLVCSFMGICSCYCCDPGGCMDCCCCSFDCCTYCC